MGKSKYCYFSRRHFLIINIFHSYLSDLKKERRLEIQGCSITSSLHDLQSVRLDDHLIYFIVNFLCNSVEAV